MIIETLCLISISLTSAQANLQIVSPEITQYENSIIQASDHEAVERFIAIIETNSEFLQPLAQAYSKIFYRKVPKTVRTLVQTFPGKEVEITRAFILANPDDIEEIVCACIRANPDAFRILTVINAITKLSSQDEILEIVDCAEQANPNIPPAQLLRAAQQNLPASQNNTQATGNTQPALSNSDGFRINLDISINTNASPDGN